MCIEILIYLSKLGSEISICQLHIFSIIPSHVICYIQRKYLIRKKEVVTTFSLFRFPFGTTLILLALVLYKFCPICVLATDTYQCIKWTEALPPCPENCNKSTTNMPFEWPHAVFWLLYITAFGAWLGKFLYRKEKLRT